MTRKWDPEIGQFRDSGKFGGNDNVAAAGGMSALATTPPLPFDLEAPPTEDNIQDLVDHYGLDHNNGEIHEFEFMTIEAPNHATTQVELAGRETLDDVRTGIRDAAREFDASDEFDKLWSPEFGAHNVFTPSQFLAGLKEDEAYFHDVEMQITLGSMYESSPGSEPDATDEFARYQATENFGVEDPYTEDNLQEIVETYGLDQGSGEIDADFGSMFLEGPHGSTLMIEFTGSSPKGLPEDMGQAKRNIAEGLERYNADEDFKEMWNPGDKGAELLTDMQADERHFKEMARRMRGSLE